MNNSFSDRGVAQLARASGSYPGGRGFDPPRRDIHTALGPLAQLVRAPRSGRGSRRFKSCFPDNQGLKSAGM